MTEMHDDNDHPDEYIVESNGPAIEHIKTWDDLNIETDILRAIYSYGFEAPSDIQKRAILPMRSGKDLIAQAQSGTGKTGAFTIGTLSHIDVSLRATQAIILAPTHELAHQIYSVCNSLSGFMDGLVIRTLVGGTQVQTDVKELRENVPHIVVGCTGRIYDMIHRRALLTNNIKICVLDEADEMLSFGFKEQIYNIFQRLPSDVQIALFSATMPPEIIQLSDRFMRDPIRIMMRPRELNLDGIKQYFVAVYNEKDKIDCLRDLFTRLTASCTIIYANNVERVVELYNIMQADGFSVCCIHRDMSKQERHDTLRRFKNGEFKLMISSNLTARGIDVQQVNTVINYDIPNSAETYLHRIGRSGRWGRKGMAINLITKRDVRQMKSIENHYKTCIDELPSNVEFL